MAFAAWQTPAPNPIETAHLTMMLSAGPAKAGTVPLHVDVTPREKMHVYAPGQRGYVAITLTLDADAPATSSGKPKYPAAEKLFMPALNETQLVYAKPFRITQAVRLRRDTGRGLITIKGSLRYQACDDTICYKPVTLPVSWRIPDR
jgi:DsbC/DsbD-like thiol-disulfide interchange protein